MSPWIKGSLRWHLVWCMGQRARLHEQSIAGAEQPSQVHDLNTPGFLVESPSGSGNSAMVLSHVRGIGLWRRRMAPLS